MLFLLTMTHSVAECPGRQPDKRQIMLERYERREQLKQELGIEVHFFLSAAPSHVCYALVEADTLAAVRGWTRGMPLAEDVTITPVEPTAEVIRGRRG